MLSAAVSGVLSVPDDKDDQKTPAAQTSIATQKLPAALTLRPPTAAPWPASWSSSADVDDEDDKEELAPMIPPAATREFAAADVEGNEVERAPWTHLAASNGLSLGSLFLELSPFSRPLRPSCLSPCWRVSRPKLLPPPPEALSAILPVGGTPPSLSAAWELLSSPSQPVRVPEASCSGQDLGGLVCACVYCAPCAGQLHRRCPSSTKG
jgi:hypothetical protein